MYQHGKQCGYTNVKMYINAMTKIDTYYYDNYLENGELAYTTTLATIEDMFFLNLYIKYDFFLQKLYKEKLLNFLFVFYYSKN